MLVLVLGGLVSVVTYLVTKVVEAGTRVTRARRRLVVDLELLEKMPEDSDARARLAVILEREATQYVDEREGPRLTFRGLLVAIGRGRRPPLREFVFIIVATVAMDWAAFAQAGGTGLPEGVQPYARWLAVLTSVLIGGELVVLVLGSTIGRSMAAEEDAAADPSQMTRSGASELQSNSKPDPPTAR